MYKEKIKELNQRIKHHLTYSQQERLAAINVERQRYKELEVSSTNTLNLCKQIFTTEVFVLDKVLEKALSDNKEKTNLLR